MPGKPDLEQRFEGEGSTKAVWPMPGFKLKTAAPYEQSLLIDTVACSGSHPPWLSREIGSSESIKINELLVRHLERGRMSKFLVLWSLEPALLGQEAVKAVFSMPGYAEKLIKEGKLDKRYHLVGKHGGAWIYDVQDNEELDRLLAMAPVYNYARYDVYPLAEMKEPGTVAKPHP